MPQLENSLEKDTGEIELNLAQQPESLNRMMFNKFKRNKLAVAGLVLLLIIALAALFAPLITSHDPYEQVLQNRLLPPGNENVLGTDKLGRDTLTRLLYGARVSLMVGFASVAGSITIGTIVGAYAGFYGGRIDAFLMRSVDIIISIPSLFLLITLVTVFKPSLYTLIAIFVLFGWTGTARLVRGEFLSLRSREYVLAAKTIGVPHRKIIFGHILPNAMGPIIVSATLGVGGVILAESASASLDWGFSLLLLAGEICCKTHRVFPLCLINGGTPFFQES